MITFSHITKTYAGQERKALDDVSFTVPSGAICVLVGPSGCGKTTTLRLVNRMIEADSGSVSIDGVDITGEPKELLRRKIGYVIQSVALFPHLTVEQNITIVPKLLKWEKAACTERAVELLNMIGLPPQQYRGKYPHQLSGGEAQRIGVARALAASQHILLMDEPFGAVDPLRREELQREFLELQKTIKKTVIFVTHDLDEAIRLGDMVVVMKDGKIVQHGAPEQILAAPINTFVREFIGQDRALKRLGCYAIADYMVEPHVLRHNQTTSTITDSEHTHWRVDEHNKVVGMIKLEEGAANTIDISSQSLVLGPHHSLKEALSRALGLGISAVPIVDNDENLIGEVRVDDIEKVNQHGLKY